MKVFSVLLLVAILLGGCAPTAKNIKADEEYQMTFVDKMKILGGLFVAYLQDTDYEPREQRKYIIYDRWNNYLPIYDVVEVAPNPARWRERRDRREKRNEKKHGAWIKTTPRPIRSIRQAQDRQAPRDLVRVRQAERN
ncbi:MAG: hypothetical protein GWN86_08105 [Desulfobacterales bacterium]|nr:hypothetical protein [Desulfobacterales bacterium]